MFKYVWRRYWRRLTVLLLLTSCHILYSHNMHMTHISHRLLLSLDVGRTHTSLATGQLTSLRHTLQEGLSFIHFPFWYSMPQWLLAWSYIAHLSLPYSLCISHKIGQRHNPFHQQSLLHRKMDMFLLFHSCLSSCQLLNRNYCFLYVISIAYLGTVYTCHYVA